MADTEFCYKRRRRYQKTELSSRLVLCHKCLGSYPHNVTGVFFKSQLFFQTDLFWKSAIFQKKLLGKIQKVKKTPVTLCGQTYNKYILKISGQMESPFLRYLRRRSRKTCIKLIKFKNYLRNEIKMNATKNNLNMSISNKLS